MVLSIFFCDREMIWNLKKDQESPTLLENAVTIRENTAVKDKQTYLRLNQCIRDNSAAQLDPRCDILLVTLASSIIHNFLYFGFILHPNRYHCDAAKYIHCHWPFYRIHNGYEIDMQLENSKRDAGW